MKRQILIILILICTVFFVSCSPKTVEKKEITINLPVGERVGYYTGEINKGLPNGFGKFETENDKGIKWYYEGEFKDGNFNGKGKSVWENGQGNEGIYENGEWIPNIKQIYDLFESQKVINLNSKASKFLSDHLDFFPVSDFDTILDYVDENVSYKMLTKEISKYSNKVIKLDNLTVAQIITEDLSMYCAKGKFTHILVVNDKLNIYELFYNGNVEDIYDGDTIKKIYGIPLGINKLEDKDGRMRVTIQIAVCYIEQ